MAYGDFSSVSQMSSRPVLSQRQSHLSTMSQQTTLMQPPASNPICYTDRYNDPIEDLELFRKYIEAANGDDSSSSRYKVAHTQTSSFGNAKSRDVSVGVKESVTPFPLLLYKLLNDASKNGTGFVVSWSFHGRAFSIHKRKQFEATILPK